MNYNQNNQNNQNNMDLGYDQMNNNLLLNHYGLSEPIINNTQDNFIRGQNTTNDNLLNNNFIRGQQNLPMDNIMLGNLSNDNLINLANNIDPNTLNGTILDDNDITKTYTHTHRNKNKDNTSLIKSLTKEIINNLKENNMSIYDNSSINSRNKKNDECNDNETNYSSNSEIKNSSKKNKKIKDIKETIEDFVVNNEIPDAKNYIQWFFDDCFNYKDFLVLFILYFVLSQEMIKDLFSKYFTSLNPDIEGKVGVQGVIIYGLILTILYMMVKKLF